MIVYVIIAEWTLQHWSRMLLGGRKTAVFSICIAAVRALVAPFRGRGAESLGAVITFQPVRRLPRPRQPVCAVEYFSWRHVAVLPYSKMALAWSLRTQDDHNAAGCNAKSSNLNVPWERQQQGRGLPFVAAVWPSLSSAVAVLHLWPWCD